MNDQFGAAGRVRRNSVEVGKKVVLLHQRHEIGFTSGKKRRYVINGIRRSRHQSQITRIDEGQGKWAMPSLEPMSVNTSLQGVQLHAEAPLVPSGDAHPEIIHAGIGGILVG